MSTRRTRVYTGRADAVDSGNAARRDRLKKLKTLSRPLSAEELAELQKLMQEFGNG